MTGMSTAKLTAFGFLLTLIVSIASAGANGSDPVLENIDPMGAYVLIQDRKGDPDFVILDVRRPEEFREGHLENAVNMDYYSDTFENDLDRLDKLKTYLIYCRRGIRSSRSLDIMKALSFTSAYDLSGGIIEWKAEGLPTVK